MKKAYESPKAEKMAFEYSSTVVASSIIKCKNETHYTDSNEDGDPCLLVTTYHVTGDVSPVLG